MSILKNSRHKEGLRTSVVTVVQPLHSRRRPLPRSRAGWLAALALGAAPAALEARAEAPASPPDTAHAGPSPDAAAQADIVVNGAVPPGSVVGDIPAQNQLNPGDIAAYGVGTVSELLDELAAQTQSDQGRDSSAGPVVLVNGQRISGVNEVSDLPTESVRRIDILPEEVALKYGYGAQRKVVNIILRRRFRSTVANGSGGLATEGKGANGSGELTLSRIHDNDRLNITARAQAAASLLESDRGIAPTTADLDDTRFRTLKPETRTYSLNGVFAHQLSDRITASFNARGSYATTDALDGLPTATLAVPATSPFATATSTTATGRFLGTRALRQDGTTAAAHAGVTVNADLPAKWRLSFTGSYDHGETRTGTDRGYDTTALQAAIDAGDPAVDPQGALPATLLGTLRRDHAVARTDSGSAQFVLMGPLFKLPAGDARASVRIGGDVNRLAADTTIDGVSSASDVSRSDANAQISLDLPITSTREHVLSAIGNLTANANAAVNRVSDVGTLGTFGYGLNWTPRTGISLIASVNEDRVAPTVQQLNNPTITTPGVRAYDYVRGETVSVTQVTGGNADLKTDDRHVLKLGLTLKPFAKADLTLTADYLNSRTRNAIGTLPATIAAVQAAYPDRYQRDADGTLTYIDTRPVNFAREDRQELRWGINFTHVLRAATRPPRRDGFAGGGPRSGGGRRPDIARGGGQGGDDGTARTGNGQAGPADGQDGQAGRPPAGTRAPGAAPDEIVVEGARSGQPAGGPPTGFDGRPPEGFGAPPPGGPDGGPPNGPPPGDGPGGPGGGFGGGPGGGGFGGGGGGGGGGGRGRLGGDNSARLQVSVYHSWYFRDDILVRDGVAKIDLLDGGASGSGGGQPRHQVQFNLGIADNGLGARISGNWQSGTVVTGSAGATAGDLRFSSLATVTFRLFANLGQRFPGKPWAAGTRLTFTVGNLFDTRQRVRDATGITPSIYQAGYLDPFGRSVSIGLRRLF